MKKYIRICNCCGNTFETDKDKQTVCLFCFRKMQHDFEFWYKYVFGNPPNRCCGPPLLVSCRTGCYKIDYNYKMNSEYPINEEDAFNY